MTDMIQEPRPSKFNRYASDILAGYGWQDICVRNNITSTRAQHYIREAVLKWNSPAPETEYSNHHWHYVSGFYQKAVEHKAIRQGLKRAPASRSGPAELLRG